MVVFVEVLLSDALIDGAGGVAALPLSLLDSEVEALQDLVIEARSSKSGTSAKWIFKSATGSLVDAKLIVAMSVMYDEGDDGGGEELDPHEENEEDEAEAGPMKTLDN
jgi:hypothetical protein